MIRDLTLEFARSNKYPSHEEWSLISKLTNLRSLVLLGSRIPSGVNQANLKPLEALFQRVTKLRLVECTFRNSSSFLSFIATFPNIQSLCINDVRLIGTNGLHDIPSNAPRPMLRELKVYEPTTEDKAARFLELCGSWLSMLSIDVLRTVELHVQINYMDPGVSLQPVLKALGPYLHRLTIDCQTPISDNVEELPAFVYCTSLRTLQLDQRTHNLSLFLAILKSIPASTISHMTVLFTPITYFLTNNLLFSNIDKTLSQMRFRDIQTLKFVLYGYDTLTPRDIQSLYEKLPSSATKGLIQFEKLNEWW
ncbi:hypothetical protein NLI96_g7296 [Meripilus lineatus]|uniref:Uncharacterized protein n=1 Tax=Meripilus lineatus TaxID=2056292 RepID=A0AAD5UZA9_9APHY|nr:hypothetical protein NLI96_g7296 [Physisporinus lineatus]